MNQFFTWSRRANAMATKAPKNGAYTAAERTHTRGQQSPTDTVMTHTLPWSARKRNGNSTHRRRHGTHIHTARTQTGGNSTHRRRRHGTHIHTARTQTGGQQTPADALTLHTHTHTHTHTHCGAQTYATQHKRPYAPATPGAQHTCRPWYAVSLVHAIYQSMPCSSDIAVAAALIVADDFEAALPTSLVAP